MIGEFDRKGKCDQFLLKTYHEKNQCVDAREEVGGSKVVVGDMKDRSPIQTTANYVLCLRQVSPVPKVSNGPLPTRAASATTLVEWGLAALKLGGAVITYVVGSLYMRSIQALG
jgi:hypothetical protein